MYAQRFFFFVLQSAACKGRTLCFTCCCLDFVAAAVKQGFDDRQLTLQIELFYNLLLIEDRVPCLYFIAA